jgi:tetratricopeptide (TPR) repeat protein
MKTRPVLIAGAAALVSVYVVLLCWIGPFARRPAAKSPEACTAEGFSLLHEKRQYASAIAAFEACIRAHPEHSDAYHGLAQAQRAAGDPVMALASHDRAIQLDPDRYDLYWERGVTYLGMGNSDGAITNFQACLERNSQFANAYLGLGQACRNKNDFKAALAHHDRAIALTPRSAWFYRERGNTYRKMGDNEKAEADFATARALEQNKR